MRRMVFVLAIGFAAGAARAQVGPSDTINVKTYGAKGDGVTDDTAAIQAAVSAAFTARKPLRIPVGRYRVTRPISVTGTGALGEGLTIVGDGADPRQYSSWAAPAAFSVLDASASRGGAWPPGRAILELVTLNNVTIRGVWFLGNGTGLRDQGDATTDGVAFIGTSFGHHIESCGFQLHGIGLDMSGGHDGSIGYSEIVNSNFTNNWYAGAWLNGGDTQFIGNFFNESSPAFADPTSYRGAGLLIAKGLSVSVIGGKIEWCSKGILLFNAGAVLVSGLLTDHNGYGIVGVSTGRDPAFDVRGLTITGSRFLASRFNHLWFAGADSPRTKVTAAIVGNVFAKGGTGGYDENTDGAVGPASNLLFVANAGTNVMTITGNSMEAGADGMGLDVGGDASSRYVILGNTGAPRVVNTGAGTVDFDGNGVDAQDGASFSVAGAHATALTLARSGVTTTVAGPLEISSFLDAPRIRDPGPPAPGRARMFFRDDGAGRTELIVQFPTGAVQVIAAEP